MGWAVLRQPLEPLQALQPGASSAGPAPAGAPLFWPALLRELDQQCACCPGHPATGSAGACMASRSVSIADGLNCCVLPSPHHLPAGHLAFQCRNFLRPPMPVLGADPAANAMATAAAARAAQAQATMHLDVSSTSSFDSSDEDEDEDDFSDDSRGSGWWKWGLWACQWEELAVGVGVGGGGCR